MSDLIAQARELLARDDEPIMNGFYTVIEVRLLKSLADALEAEKQSNINLNLELEAVAQMHSDTLDRAEQAEKERDAAVGRLNTYFCETCAKTADCKTYLGIGQRFTISYCEHWEFSGQQKDVEESR